MRSPGLKETGIIVLGLCVAAMPSCAAITNSLQAWFRFDGDGQDSLGRCPVVQHTNTSFAEGAILVNGQYENGGGPAPCRLVATIPRLSYESFTVSCDFLPRDFDTQRSARIDWLRSLLWRVSGGRFGQFDGTPHDTILMGGTGYRWLGYRQQNGQLELTLNNQRTVCVFTNVPVQPGRWHNLTCSADFSRREILTWLDGQKLQIIRLPADFRLEIIGSSAEATDREFTTCNYSNGSAFHGYLDNLMVFGRALSEVEILDLFRETAASQRRGAAGEFSEIYLAQWLALLVAGVFGWWLYQRRRKSAER